MFCDSRFTMSTELRIVANGFFMLCAMLDATSPIADSRSFFTLALASANLVSVSMSVLRDADIVSKDFAISLISFILLFLT